MLNITSKKSPRLLLNSNNENGFTLLEFIISSLITVVVSVAMVSSINQISKYSNDRKVKLLTNLKAQSVIDMIAPEIRMAGNGVPFHQQNFLIGNSILSDVTATEPLLVGSCTATDLNFRINESGEMYMVTTDFNPAISTAITVFNASGIKVGDKIYITNAVVDFDDGFYGTVTGVNTITNIITVSNSYVSSPSAVFYRGSLMEVVPTITYTSSTDWSGITRNNGSGAILLSTNSKINFSYLDRNIAVMTLPLIATATNPYPANGLQNLRTIRVNVQSKSDQRLLATGEYYITEVSLDIGIRNFNYTY